MIQKPAAQQIVETLELVHRGRPVEIRALGIPAKGKRAVWSGYFDDYELAAEAAIHCEENLAEGVYMTVNRINPALMARGPNLLDKHARHATSAGDIEHVQWALIDVDPRRPSGVSSTDDELARAIAVRDEIALEFHDRCEIIRACSGNGAHLLVGPSLFEEWEELIDLAAIAAAYDDDVVKVDTSADSIRKPAQIVRLYGTLARKGYEYGGRHHRRSHIEKE
jgi:hypothetical protein